MNSETDIGLRFTANVSGNGKLEKLAQNLAIIKSVSDGMNTGVINSMKAGSNATKDIAQDTSTMANTMKLAFNFSTVRMFARTLGKVTTQLTKMAQASSDYLENINLFQVAFDGSYKSAERFVDKITEMYGLDESRITRVVGIFKQLGNAMNVSAETGERLATLMTQMSLDISSLYNIDFERATSVLQSAFSGQTKPIRGATGADITQSTLQTTLDGLGIDKMVSDLTFAEKRLLIIISLTEQLQEATNDLGRTIESPANQLKVLSEQWSRLTRALGNVFLPILAKILPYLNAIMMVLTEIINMIAKLFGYKASDYDYFSGVDESVQEFEEDIKKSTGSVGKLKKALSGLRSFDKLNVISTPNSGGGAGGSGGLGTGIDPDLLKAFNSAFDAYNDKLEKVKMKASKIRDSIMEWLGFTKEIDPATGKIVWKYQGIKTTLKNIWNWFKNLSGTAKTLLIILTGIFGAKALTAVAKMLGLFSKTKIGKSLTTMVTSFSKILGYSKELTAVAGNAKEGIFAGVEYWNKTASGVEKTRTAIGGIVAYLGGLTSVGAAMKDISNNGMNAINAIGLVGGTMSSTLGGMMTGIAVTGSAWGGLAGAAVGAVSSIVSAIINYETEGDRMVKKSKESLKEVQKTAKEIKKEVADTQLEIASQMYETNYHQKLLDEFETIIDKNGKVKDGYEERAKYITGELASAYGVEYELEDGVYKKVDETNKEVQKRIDLKKQEILLEAYKEDYINALKRENELYMTMNKKQDERNAFYDEYNTKLQETAKFTGLEGVALEDLIKIDEKRRDGVKLSKKESELWSAAMIGGYKDVIESAKNYDKAVDTATKNYQNNKKIEMNYSNLATAVETGDVEQIEKATSEFNKTYVDGEKVKTMTTEEEMNKRVLDREAEVKNMKKNYGDQYEAFKKNLTDMSNYMDGTASPKMVEDWIALGNTSSKEFVKALSGMEEGIQRDIITQMYQNGYDISTKLQEGLDDVPLSKTIKMEVDQRKVDNWFKNNKLGQAVAKFLPNLSYSFSTNAEGGLPPVGQLFVANEKGPELIGQIGGQSFVANQKEIVDFMDRKLQTATGGNNGTQVYNIYLDEYHKIGTYTLEQLQGMAKTNGKPIKIG